MSILDYTEPTAREYEAQERAEAARTLSHMENCPAAEYWDDVDIQLRDDVLWMAYKLIADGKRTSALAYIEREMDKHLEAAREVAIRNYVG